MSNVNYPEDARAWPVVSVRNVRAASAGEAVDLTEEEILVSRKVDTGEAGHTAGGRVLGVLEETDEDGWDSLTVNMSLQEAALLLLSVSMREGDDGTGGVSSETDVKAAIDLATDALVAMKEARSH